MMTMMTARFSKIPAHQPIVTWYHCPKTAKTQTDITIIQVHRPPTPFPFSEKTTEL